MGYTRYWDRTSKEITPEFVEAVKKIVNDCKEKGISLTDGMQEGEPIITIDEISINAPRQNDLGHESFDIYNGETGFNFCKTARKPYDYAVREILKIAEQMGIVKNVRSDGENDEIISDYRYVHGFEGGGSLLFKADDCNDPDWITIIEILKKNLPNFRVSYGKGHWMNFEW